MELPEAGMSCLEFIAALMGYLVPAVATAVGISAGADAVKVGYEWTMKGALRK